MYCLYLSPHSRKLKHWSNTHTKTHTKLVGVNQHVWECWCRAETSLLSCEASCCLHENTTPLPPPSLLSCEDHLLPGLHVLTGTCSHACYQITPYLGTSSSLWWLTAETPPYGSARGSVCVNSKPSPESSTWKNQSDCSQRDLNHFVPVQSHFAVCEWLSQRTECAQHLLLHNHHVTRQANSELKSKVEEAFCELPHDSWRPLTVLLSWLGLLVNTQLYCVWRDTYINVLPWTQTKHQ